MQHHDKLAAGIVLRSIMGQRVRQALARARHDATAARIGQLALEAAAEAELLEVLPALLAEALGVESVAVVAAADGPRPGGLRAATGPAWPLQGTQPRPFAGEHREPWLIDDIAADPAAAALFPLPLPPAGSAIMVPVLERHQALGALVAVAGTPRRFDHDSRHLLQSAAATLSAFVRQRRADEQLAHAHRLDAIGQLTGGVAHDFNNLLTAIQGHADLLLSDLPPEDAIRADLQEIREAADRATSLTRQLLAFSRRQVMQPRVLDANGVVRDMERMLRRLIGENILLSTQLTDDAGRVRADPTQLEQVLLNLVVNARDAMPDGGSVVISTRHRSFDRDESLPVEMAAGDYVEITVNDSGGGMPPTVAARAFEPFFTTKPPGQGTGLGLSTVYGIVKQSGGHVWLSSSPREGTSVTILLPRVEDEADVATPVATTNGGDHHGTETILLVEDEKSVRDLARRILERRGYTVLPATDGGQALEIAESDDRPIHLLLTDVIMPGLNGQDVAQRVRSLRPDVRVLFMSGYNEEAVLRHGVLAAGTAFIEKPFSPAKLLEQVRAILQADREVSAE